MLDYSKDVLIAANAAISKLDFDGFLEHCTDDVKWTMVGERTIQGKQAVLDWMKETCLEAPDFKVNTLIAEGDWLAALGEISVKDKKGAVSRSSYCDVWRLREGRLAELKAYVVDEASERGLQSARKPLEASTRLYVNADLPMRQHAILEHSPEGHCAQVEFEKSDFLLLERVELSCSAAVGLTSPAPWRVQPGSLATSSQVTTLALPSAEMLLRTASG